ncbi:MAG: hypothetical protein ABJD24_18205 [Acidimicrobiales bacterium]
MEFEDRIRNELGSARDGFVPSASLEGQITRRVHRRVRNRRLAMGGGLAVLIAGVALPLALRDRDHRSSVVLVPPPDTTSAPTETAVTSVAPGTTIAERTTTAPTATTAVEPISSPPTRFIAAVGAGNEQAVLMSTADGSLIKRYDGDKGGQVLRSISFDRKTLYVATPGAYDCGFHYATLDVATGEQTGTDVYADIPSIGRFVLGPKEMAWTDGCGKEGPVHIGDRTLDLGSGPVGFAWRPDGQQLAVVLPTVPGTIVLVDVATMTTTKTLTARDPTCGLSVAAYAGSTLITGEHCPDGTVALLWLQSDGTWMGSALPIAGKAYAIVDLDIADGRWALVDVSMTEPPGGDVYMLDLHNLGLPPRKVASDAYEAFWVPD